MSDKIYVASVDVLERLESVLAKFARAGAEKIEAASQTAERERERLDNRCRQIEADADYWASAYDEADDEEDDVSFLAFKRDEAQQKLRLARHHESLVAEASENFARRARRVSAISDARLSEARTFLRQKIQQLYEYATVQPYAETGNVGGSSAASAGSFGTASAATGAAPKTAEIPPDDLSKIALPEGFKWIRLDEIEERDMNDLPTENQFGKVPYDDMRRGLEMFEREILPALRDAPEKANADYFEAFDRENGRQPNDSAKKIFNVFFRRQFHEYIRVERFDGDARYSITNGRHRIKVARDLGWTAIPAQAVEVKRK